MCLQGTHWVPAPLRGCMTTHSKLSFQCWTPPRLPCAFSTSRTANDKGHFWFGAFNCSEPPWFAGKCSMQMFNLQTQKHQKPTSFPLSIQRHHCLVCALAPAKGREWLAKARRSRPHSHAVPAAAPHHASLAMLASNIWVGCVQSIQLR